MPRHTLESLRSHVEQGDLDADGARGLLRDVEALRRTLIRAGRAAGAGLSDSVSTGFLTDDDAIAREVEAKLAATQKALDDERRCRLANEAEMHRADAEIGRLRERVRELEAEVGRLTEEMDRRWEEGLGLEQGPHGFVDPACVTFHDGCHCTVETLRYNIERADTAEARASELEGRLRREEERADTYRRERDMASLVIVRLVTHHDLDDVAAEGEQEREAAEWTRRGLVEAGYLNPRATHPQDNTPSGGGAPVCGVATKTLLDGIKVCSRPRGHDDEHCDTHGWTWFPDDTAAPTKEPSHTPDCRDLECLGCRYLERPARAEQPAGDDDYAPDEATKKAHVRIARPTPTEDTEGRDG